MKTPFTEYYRMPLLVLFLTIAWIMIVSRIWTALRYRQYKLHLLSVTSVAFVFFAGLLTTVYIGLNIATYAIDQTLFKFYDQISNIAKEDTSSHDLTTLTRKECDWIIELVIRLLKMTSASRVLLVAALWSVKASLACVYLESAPILRSFSRRVLQSTAPMLLITGMLAIWITIQSIVVGVTYPTIDDIKNGAYTNGVTFIELDDMSELGITVLNIVTDILLLYLAYKITTVLTSTARAGWLLYIMSTITITLAIARIIFVVLSITCVGSCSTTSLVDRIMTPIVFVAECEAFAAIVVGCLPGLRAALRCEDITPKIPSKESSFT